MKTLLIIGSASLSVLSPLLAQADELARVVSTTPVIQQIGVPRQICTEVPVTGVAGQKSGGGALLGAITGGALGNAVGHGAGRAAATALGVVGGAIVGDRLETQPIPSSGTALNCTTEITYENRIVAYTVVYDYGGKQYSVQMPNNPGQFVHIQISPIVSEPVHSTTLTTTPVTVVSSPSVVNPVYVTSYPGWYAPPAYVTSPVSLSIGLGYYGTYGNYGGHRNHWR